MSSSTLLDGFKPYTRSAHTGYSILPENLFGSGNGQNFYQGGISFNQFCHLLLL